MDSLIKIFLLGTLVLGVQNSEIQIDGYNLPKVDDWWGTEESKCENDTSIKPFKIKFEEAMITDLKDRLKNHRSFTPPLKGANFTYGFNTDYMQGWIDYWAESYNFTAREAYLNQFSHYKTNIQGLNIHFIRITPKVSSDIKVIPLLLLHGWTGSIREFYKTIPLLTAIDADRDYAMEVIAPSLPGFGFSDPATRPGMGSSEMAVILKNLMIRLGYTKFYVQGGDWGAYIASDMCTLFPQEILGHHTNLAFTLHPAALGTWIFGTFQQSAVVDAAVADRLYPILTIIQWLVKESGYFHLQTTKPDTAGIAMSDSPSGLLAYMFQLMATVTRKANDYKDDGGLEEYFTRDELLDNLMIYWMTNSFTTSSRIYSESYNIRSFNMGVFATPTPVPTWTIHAKDEIIYQSPAMLKFKFTNHLNATILDDGGHYLALEKPEVFAEDVLKAITAFRYWHANQACSTKDEL